MFLIMAKLMWGFDIQAADDQAKVDENKNWTAGFMTKPLPFEARFKIRSDKHEEVMRREWKSAEKDVDLLMDGIEERRVGLR